MRKRALSTCAAENAEGEEGGELGPSGEAAEVRGTEGGQRQRLRCGLCHSHARYGER